MLTHNENMLIVNKYGYFRDTCSLYLKQLVFFFLANFSSLLFVLYYFIRVTKGHYSTELNEQANVDSLPG